MADKKKNTGGAMRLDRLLGEMGIGSRSQIRKMAGKGLIAVNGTAVKAADVKVRPGADVILVERRPVTYVAQEYYMLNKPPRKSTWTRCISSAMRGACPGTPRGGWRMDWC